MNIAFCKDILDDILLVREINKFPFESEDIIIDDKTVDFIVELLTRAYRYIETALDICKAYHGDLDIVKEINYDSFLDNRVLYPPVSMWPADRAHQVAFIRLKVEVCMRQRTFGTPTYFFLQSAILPLREVEVVLNDLQPYYFEQQFPFKETSHLFTNKENGKNQTNASDSRGEVLA